MSVVMQIISLANGEPSPFDGKFLAEYDPDRQGVDPSGLRTLAHVVVTADPDEAIMFEDAGEAMETWKRVSKRWPTRPFDHQPNRPLTAFSVQVRRLEDARGE
jgi:hypothetical protein